MNFRGAHTATRQEFCHVIDSGLVTNRSVSRQPHAELSWQLDNEDRIILRRSAQGHDFGCDAGVLLYLCCHIDLLLI